MREIDRLTNNRLVPIIAHFEAVNKSLISFYNQIVDCPTVIRLTHQHCNLHKYGVIEAFRDLRDEFDMKLVNENRENPAPLQLNRVFKCVSFKIRENDSSQGEITLHFRSSLQNIVYGYQETMYDLLVNLIRKLSHFHGLQICVLEEGGMNGQLTDEFNQLFSLITMAVPNLNTITSEDFLHITRCTGAVDPEPVKPLKQDKKPTTTDKTKVLSIADFDELFRGFLSEPSIAWPDCVRNALNQRLGAMIPSKTPNPIGIEDELRELMVYFALILDNWKQQLDAKLFENYARAATRFFYYHTDKYALMVLDAIVLHKTCVFDDFVFFCKLKDLSQEKERVKLARLIERLVAYKLIVKQENQFDAVYRRLENDEFFWADEFKLSDPKVSEYFDHDCVKLDAELRNNPAYLTTEKLNSEFKIIFPGSVRMHKSIRALAFFGFFDYQYHGRKLIRCEEYTFARCVVTEAVREQWQHDSVTI